MRDLSDVDRRALLAATQLSTRQNIILHLTQLAMFKRFTGEQQQLQSMLEIMATDLMDFSEFAIANACQHFRLRDPSPWFPVFADLYAKARQNHEQYTAMRQDMLLTDRAGAA